jgi:nucleoid-associated protein YgaU
MTMPLRLLRAATSAGLAAGLGAALWHWAAPGLQGRAHDPSSGGIQPASWSLADVVSLGASVAALASYAALIATAAVAVAAHLAGPRAEAAVTRRGLAGPRLWQSLVLAACGLGLGVQSAAAAGAADAGPRPARPGSCTIECDIRLDGLPYPDLPVASGPARLAHPRPERRAAGETVTVHAGDCLWTIAARLLPPGAGAAEIAVRVAALYDANRQAVGTDPDLIHPGTLLRLAKGSS